MKKVLSLVLLAVVLLTMFSLTAFAANNLPPITYNPAFDVEIADVTAQIEGTEGYYDLELKPNEMQPLPFQIFNRLDKEIKVKVEAITATTAVNGQIEYSRPGISDSSLKYPFTNLVEPVSQIITIPPRTIEDAYIRVTAPSISYDGIILGSVLVTLVNDDEVEVAGIASQFPVVKGVRLTENKNHQRIEPDFKLANGKVLAGEKSAAFVCNVRNPKPALYKNSVITAQLLRGSDEVFSAKRKVDFAPNSKYPLTLIHGERIEPGEYTARIKIVSEDEEVFLLEGTFTVRENDPNLDDIIGHPSGQIRAPEDIIKLWPLWLKILVLVVIFYVIISLLWLLILLIRKRKKKKEDQSQSEDDKGGEYEKCDNQDYPATRNR